MRTSTAPRPVPLLRRTRTWRRSSLRAATARFCGKDVRFILGAEDACNCNSPGFANAPACFPSGGALTCAPSAAGGPGCYDTYPDATSSNALDVGCEAMAQGTNRLQRGLLYVQHLNRSFPTRAAGPFSATVVPGMGHDNTAEYVSAVFQAVAYA